MFFNKENDGKPTPPGTKRRIVPLLPLRDIIVFPHMVSQLFVGRERSINALDAAMERVQTVVCSVGTMRRRFAAGDTYLSSDYEPVAQLVDSALRMKGRKRFFVLVSALGARPGCSP